VEPLPHVAADPRQEWSRDIFSSHLICTHTINFCLYMNIPHVGKTTMDIRSSVQDGGEEKYSLPYIH
jgi:hypothetical protein